MAKRETHRPITIRQRVAPSRTPPQCVLYSKPGEVQDSTSRVKDEESLFLSAWCGPRKCQNLIHGRSLRRRQVQYHSKHGTSCMAKCQSLILQPRSISEQEE